MGSKIITSLLTPSAPTIVGMVGSLYIHVGSSITISIGTIGGNWYMPDILNKFLIKVMQK